ncbi:hypothetical protein [Streptomyces sp. NPDC054854]
MTAGSNGRFGHRRPVGFGEVAGWWAQRGLQRPAHGALTPALLARADRGLRRLVSLHQQVAEAER